MRTHQLLNIVFAIMWIAILILAGMAVWNFELQPIVTMNVRYEFLGILLLKVTCVTIALGFLRYSLGKSLKPSSKLQKDNFSSGAIQML